MLAGLTNISDIRAFEYVDGVKRPADGQLLYRGYDVKDLINGSRGGRFAFEEAGYLLLFGELPPRKSWKNSAGCWASAAPCPPTLPVM